MNNLNLCHNHLILPGLFAQLFMQPFSSDVDSCGRSYISACWRLYILYVFPPNCNTMSQYGIYEQGKVKFIHSVLNKGISHLFFVLYFAIN